MSPLVMATRRPIAIKATTYTDVIFEEGLCIVTNIQYSCPINPGLEFKIFLERCFLFVVAGRRAWRIREEVDH